MTFVSYVNGIYTTEYSDKDNLSSAVETTNDLIQLLRLTPRFGLNSNLRNNVLASYIYNRSMRQEIKDWRNEHGCEAKQQRDSKLMKVLHSMKRFADCKGVPLIFWLIKNDLWQAAKQVAHLEIGIGTIDEESRKVAYAIREHHQWPGHVILVGHSQGNLMIAEALEVLPSIDTQPINVGDHYCPIEERWPTS